MKFTNFIPLLFFVLSFWSCKVNNSVDDFISNYEREFVVVEKISFVNVEEAKKIADDFFFKNELSSTRANRSENDNNADINIFRNQKNDTLFYLINYENNKGFVLVSATKKSPPILAFSGTSSFDTDNQGALTWLSNIAEDIVKYKDNPNVNNMHKWTNPVSIDRFRNVNKKAKDLAYWQSQTVDEFYEKYNNNLPSGYNELYGDLIAQRICYLSHLESEVGEAANSLFGHIRERMENHNVSEEDVFAHVLSFYKNDTIHPMIDTYWHQSDPYNEKIEDGCLVGCVPVAVGQIMNYHKHPFDYAKWDAIDNEKKQLESKNYSHTLVKQDETAKLLSKIGSDIGMIYGKDKSYPSYMDKFFKSGMHDITGVVNFFKSSGYEANKAPVDNYMERRKIEVSLQQGRPVYMEGVRKNLKILGVETPIPNDAHAWVCDGRIRREEVWIVTGIYLPVNSHSIEGIYETNPYIDLGGFTHLDIFEDTFLHMNWGWGKHDKAQKAKDMWVIAKDSKTDYTKHFKYISVKPKK